MTRAPLLLLLLLLLVPAAAGAAAPPARDKLSRTPTALLERGLDRAVARGWASAADAAADRDLLRRTDAALGRVSGWRREQLAGALASAAARWRALTPPRLQALFPTLEVNLRRFAGGGSGSEMTGADGAVYRLFSGHGLQFHPLATVAALNRLAQAGDAVATQQVADALLARALHEGPALVFPYWFDYGRGRAPWRSGMAQAVAAQAFARAADVCDEPRLRLVARGAFAAIPRGLLSESEAGPWIRLYGFDRSLVLNAQLQTALSLSDYAERTGDAGAANLATNLEAAASALLPGFDTGAWSLYALRGAESTLGYHEYVVSLLRRVATRFGDEGLGEAADRFQGYLDAPPELRAGAAPAPIYPRPVDGFRDVARVSFWLSKRSQVVLHAGGRPVTGSFPRGWSTIDWAPGPGFAAGEVDASLTAVGPAGHRAELPLAPIVVEREEGPPAVSARLVGGVLRWRGDDPGTPWLALRVRLRAGGSSAVVDLGRRPLAGSARVRLPRGRWAATLLAANSAGWTAQVPLGALTGRAAR